ncbi:MAG: hypothetical protein QOF25_1756 [Mycobacterium sp.]|nr:hypothetical protein [Mycobacterium sp.]
MSTTAGRYRRVTSPLTPEALQPLPADSEGIQFSQPLREDEYRRLAELLERHPDKRLLALQLESTRQEHITDLGFLRPRQTPLLGKGTNAPNPLVVSLLRR